MNVKFFIYLLLLISTCSLGVLGCSDLDWPDVANQSKDLQGQSEKKELNLNNLVEVLFSYNESLHGFIYSDSKNFKLLKYKKDHSAESASAYEEALSTADERYKENYNLVEFTIEKGISDEIIFAWQRIDAKGKLMTVVSSDLQIRRVSKDELGWSNIYQSSEDYHFYKFGTNDIHAQGELLECAFGVKKNSSYSNRNDFRFYYCMLKSVDSDQEKVEYALFHVISEKRTHRKSDRYIGLMSNHDLGRAQDLINDYRVIHQKCKEPQDSNTDGLHTINVAPLESTQKDNPTKKRTKPRKKPKTDYKESLPKPPQSTSEDLSPVSVQNDENKAPTENNEKEEALSPSAEETIPTTKDVSNVSTEQDVTELNTVHDKL